MVPVTQIFDCLKPIMHYALMLSIIAISFWLDFCYIIAWILNWEKAPTPTPHPAKK